MNSNDIRGLLHDMFSPYNYDIKQIVNNNIYEDLSIEELAHLCHLSLSSFKRKFKIIFKDSPASYMKNKRLVKAAQLLQISQDRIVNICLDTGFSNVDSFSKSFKQKFGLSPSEYRKNAHGLN